MDIRSNGNKASELYIPLQGQTCPFVAHNGRREQVVNMNGKEIYKFAVSSMPDSIKSALTLAGLEVRDIDYLIPHQANIKMINSIAEKVGLAPEQVVQLDLADPGRAEALRDFAWKRNGRAAHNGTTPLYPCGGGAHSFAIDAYGRLRASHTIFEYSNCHGAITLLQL